MATPQQWPANSPVGRDTRRIDGPFKVTGLAQYTSDFRFPGMLYAVPVEATIANDRVLKLDTATAEKMPGVRAILHRGNIVRIFTLTYEACIQVITQDAPPPFQLHLLPFHSR